MSHRILSAMLMVITIGFSITLSCRASSVEKPTELDFILSCNPIRDVPRAGRERFDLSGVSEVKMLLIGSIRFYQRFISTQDMPSCNFVPSCSQFGAESIGRLGIFRGILLTSDRLQRCNSMSISRYQRDHKSGKLIDPVQIYAEIIR